MSLSISRPLVLVVDDCADNRELYAEYLRLQGIAVATAASGYEAIAMALAEPPSLILMDLAMPGMSGGDALRRLRQDAKTVAIPIIALTARVLQHGHAG